MGSNLDLSNSLAAAKALLGWKLVHETRGGKMSGFIVETEAYNENDPASHAFGGKRVRNAAMFERAGTLYVYFTYGMHFCLNIVTGEPGRGEAVLIRALEPVEGIEQMAKNRRNAAQVSHSDAAQGSNENRAKRTEKYGERDSQAADTAMRLEPASAASSAGRQGVAVRNLCNGPAKLVQALGIGRQHSGKHLDEGTIKLEPGFKPKQITQTTRIGISKATEQPWRFYVTGSKFVSKP